MAARSSKFLDALFSASFRVRTSDRLGPALGSLSATVATMEKIATLLESEKAELWINHDKSQSARIPKSLQHFE